MKEKIVTNIRKINEISARRTERESERIGREIDRMCKHNDVV